MVRRIMRPARRGQSGIEFLAVTGIGMLLLLGVSFLLLSDSRTSRDEAEIQQAAQVGAVILSQANIVLAQGTNSWVTVEAQMPQSVKGIYLVDTSVAQKSAIVFEMQTSKGLIYVPVFSKLDLEGPVSAGSPPLANNFIVGSNWYIHAPPSTGFSPSGGKSRIRVIALPGSKALVTYDTT